MPEGFHLSLSALFFLISCIFGYFSVSTITIGLVFMNLCKENRLLNSLEHFVIRIVFVTLKIVIGDHKRYTADTQ